MRELILLRHAEAAPAGTMQADRERELTARGHTQAEAVAAWLQAGGIFPDRCLHSPAVRARQTAEHVHARLGGATPLPAAAIWEASAGELLAIAAAHADCERLLLVGHNPGLEHLLRILAGGGAARGLPPAGLARLTVATPLEPGCARLADYRLP